MLQITDLYISDQRLRDCIRRLEKIHSGFLRQSLEDNFSQRYFGPNLIFNSCFYLSICLFQRISLLKSNLPQFPSHSSPDIAEPILEHPSINAIRRSSYNSHLHQQISLTSLLGLAPLLISKYLIQEKKSLNLFIHLFDPSFG